MQAADKKKKTNKKPISGFVLVLASKTPYLTPQKAFVLI